MSNGDEGYTEEEMNAYLQYLYGGGGMPDDGAQPEYTGGSPTFDESIAAEPTAQDVLNAINASDLMAYQSQALDDVINNIGASYTPDLTPLDLYASIFPGLTPGQEPTPALPSVSAAQGGATSGGSGVSLGGGGGGSKPASSTATGTDPLTKLLMSLLGSKATAGTQQPAGSNLTIVLIVGLIVVAIVFIFRGGS